MSEEKVLSSPIKRKIVYLLKTNGPMIFKTIKDEIAISSDSLKIALNDLENDGIVKRRKGKVELTELGKTISKKISSID
jgi:predicted transcriptional regulator